MNGVKWNLGRYACLLHFFEDSGSGVFVDQSAVTTCRLQTFYLSKNLEQDRSTFKFKLLYLSTTSICHNSAYISRY